MVSPVGQTFYHVIAVLLRHPADLPVGALQADGGAPQGRPVQPEGHGDGLPGLQRAVPVQDTRISVIHGLEDLSHVPVVPEPVAIA